MLPLLNNEERIEDLQELAINVEGSSDGQFNNNDKVVFYGQSPNQWKYDSIDGLFKHQLHYFSDFTFYFLRVNHEQGLRVQDAAVITQPEDVVVTSFNDYAFRESEEINLIKSGRKWYGDAFGFTTNRDFNFSFPNCDGPIHLKSVFATAVPAPYSSVYSIDLNGESVSIIHLGLAVVILCKYYHCSKSIFTLPMMLIFLFSFLLHMLELRDGLII